MKIILNKKSNCVCMCVCVFVWVCICMCVFVHVCACACFCLCVKLSVHILKYYKRTTLEIGSQIFGCLIPCVIFQRNACWTVCFCKFCYVNIHTNKQKYFYLLFIQRKLWLFWNNFDSFKIKGVSYLNLFY